jgi:hypothetical protein
MVAGAATCLFRPTATAPPTNAVIAIESAFPAHRPQPHGKCNLLFYCLAMPFHNRNYRAFNQFLAGDIEARLFRRVRSFRRYCPRRYLLQQLPVISSGPRAMPTGGLLRPEFGNKPTIASPEGAPAGSRL